MSSPTILFVPGFWEGPAPFAQVSSLLRGSGFPTEIAALPSTGKLSPGSPSMLDDIAAIRSAVTKLVESGKEVVMVMHSGGGFVGSNAIEGLGIKARGEAERGVIKLVFLTAAVFPEGFKLQPLPFFAIDVCLIFFCLLLCLIFFFSRDPTEFTVVQGGAMHCKSPETNLFNDLDPASAEKWTKELQPQPSEGWADTVTYCGWKDVPSVYLVCENDQVIPAPMQLQLAELAGSKVEKCGAGHMPFLSMPEKVAEVVKNAIA